MSTSLVDDYTARLEQTPVGLSTIADAWIHVAYLAQAGERNRTLSVIKARGTAHSNQVRELVLRSEGISLAEVYTAGGEVLLGTLRYEKEHELERAERDRRQEAERMRRRAEADLAAIRAKLEALGRQREELETLLAEEVVHDRDRKAHRDEERRAIRSLRNGPVGDDE